MAQTYKFGSGTWATKKGSTLAYNDENNNFKPLPFSFTRNSIATRVNKEGLIEVVGNDIPRIDYTDSADGVLLLEPQRTNLFTYSEDFTQDWISGGAGAFTITQNAVVSPDGTQNASKLIASGVGHQLRQNKAIINTQMSNSFYMRTNQGTRQMSIRINDNEITQTFTVTSEWKRYTVSGLVGGTLNGSGRCSLNNVDVLDENNHVYVWGAQLEEGSYATSYIPTSGSTVQRSAETCNGSGNSEVFNDSEGVLFADISALANDSTNRTIGILGDSSNLIELAYRNSTNQIRCLIKSSGVFEVNIQHTLSDITLNNKLAVKYKSNNASLYVNGFEVATDLSASMPSGLSELNFNRFDGGEDFYGKTKEVAYYDAILTDLELETLTSYRSLNELVTELNLNTL